MPVAASTPIELINGVYATLDERIGAGRERLGRGLTLAEKILVNHLDNPTITPERGCPMWICGPTGWPCRTPPPRWRGSSS